MSKLPFALSVALSACVAFANEPFRKRNDAKSTVAATFDVLDLNGDDQVDPYEAAVAIQHAARWNDSGTKRVSRRHLARYIRQSSSLESEDADCFMQRHDSDRDGQLSTHELDNANKEFFVDADFNVDGRVTMRELKRSLRFGNLIPSFDNKWIADELEAWMEDDSNKDKMLSRSETSASDWKEIEVADSNSDGKVDAHELEESLRGNFCEAAFAIERNVATMIGMIGPSTPARVMELIVEHPDVDTIVMQRVPGSIDEEANQIASEMIHLHRFAVIVPERGLIASGGTDFFLAATQRSAHPKSQIGVHAWSDVRGSATRDREAEEHQLYLASYRELDIPTEFYWFSLDAAPASEMHWMTLEERAQFGMTTVASSQ